MDQNNSLGSNVDWVHSLRKISTWLCGTNFCINCSSSPRFAPSFMQLRNDPKCAQTLWNTKKMSLGSNGVDQVRSLQKIPTWLRGTNFCINCTSSPHFAPSFMQLQNYPKCVQTLWNTQKMSLGSNGVDQVRWLRKITMWLHGTNFCINCTSLVCLATSFMQLRNDPKCTQILWNALKHWYRVQRGGLVVFVAKNPDVTSWHELFL